MRSKGRDAEDAKGTQKTQKIPEMILACLGLGWVRLALGASTLHSLTPVIPTQAGIHAFDCALLWIPACAGMTVTRGRLGARVTETSGRLCAEITQSESECATASATVNTVLAAIIKPDFCVFLRLLRNLCALCALHWIAGAVPILQPLCPIAKPISGIFCVFCAPFAPSAFCPRIRTPHTKQKKPRSIHFRAFI